MHNKKLLCYPDVHNKILSMEKNQQGDSGQLVMEQKPLHYVVYKMYAF